MLYVVNRTVPQGRLRDRLVFVLRRYKNHCLIFVNLLSYQTSSSLSVEGLQEGGDDGQDEEYDEEDDEDY